MFGVVSFRYLCLGIIFYIQLEQCIWAAVPRPTRLRVQTSVARSVSSMISGDKARFNVNVKHEKSSKVKAVDAHLQIKFPLYLVFNSYETANGVVPTSIGNTSTTFNFKFSEIPLAQSIKLTVIVDVDPYFMHVNRETVFLSTDVDFWYYGEDGPCDRPTSHYNANHEQRSWNIEFLASKACEQRINTTLGAPLQDHQYFASSVTPGNEAHLASLSKPGVWVPASSYASDRNQFLQIDFERLIKVTKIATRGMTKPEIAFVRSYHLYYSINLIEWSGYQENHKLKMFSANTDGTSLVASSIPLPINARYIRIVPRTWKTKRALELQVHGCPVHPVTTLLDFCPFFDFESALTGWSKTGTAFDNQPTIGDNLRARTGQSADIQGNGWIATAEDRRLPYLLARATQGDEPTGTLTSPKFYIASSKLYFLIGGTANSTKARAELLVDGVVVRTASGDGESLTEKVWNVEEFIKKEAVLHLVDNATDGHINFDALRIDCHLEADAKNITLPTRSMLLNPSTHSLYVCESTHLSHKDDSRCKMTSNNIDRWIDVPNVLGILGVDKSLNKLYAVSNDRHVLVSLRSTGREWRYITRSEWDEAKFMPTMLLVRNVIWKSSIEGAADDVHEILNDDNGEKWKATSSSISFKGVGQNWTAIASWFCQASDVADDPCISEPCQYSTKCVNPSPGQYKCICLPGYTGVNCEVDIDDCANHSCLNDASCRDGPNSYYCVCKYGYGGKSCNIVLSGCRSFPCLNRGTCADLDSGNFNCTCSAKYRGTLCEIAINKCESFPCKNSGKCIPDDTSYRCLCPERYYGTNCQSVRHSHFTVVSTNAVTSTNDYLVIKATIPSHGRSLWPNWCEDYKKLCVSQGGWLPTGVGLSYNHIKHHSSCRDKYDSVMDSANILGTTPNTKVAELAQNAGFSNATSYNSFAFNMCSEDNCSKTLPVSGCEGALSCISQTVPNYEVYTVCTIPNTNFKIYHSGWITYNGLYVLIVSVQLKSSSSKHENWCRDYEKLCKSYGLRPTGKDAGFCQDNYNSLVFKNFDRYAVRNAGNQVRPTSYYFNFYDCSQCNSYYSSNYGAMYGMSSTSYILNTACANPQDVGLQVLDEKTVEYDGANYLVLKAQVPEGGLSNGASWCHDIQSLCESYGGKPIGCEECSVKYRSVLPASNLGCPPSADVIAQIANNAGFSEAKDTNSFVLNKCGKCSKRISEGACDNEDFFCLGADNTHQVVYTVCYRAAVHAFEVLATKSTIYASLPYLVIKTRLPSSRKYRSQNWCQDYQRLCESYGTKPTGCGSSYTGDATYSTCRDSYGSVMPSDNHLGCGSTTIPYQIAKAAGFSSANSKNTFVFHQCLSSQCSTSLTYSCYSTTCKCHPSLGCIHSSISSSYREAYAVCVGTRAFEVLETRTTSNSNGDGVFVVKARLPSNGVASFENWCEDYRQLCLAYGWRPTGCGAHYSNKLEYVTCRSRYQSVMSYSSGLTCPPNYNVSAIANSAGFTNANKENSFAFSDCTNLCAKVLTVGNAFINVSAVNSEVYTVCVSSNSNFKVLSNRNVNYNGGQYLFVEAQVPLNYKSKHSDWCMDYMRMCESFGLRPVGLSGREGSSLHFNCIKKYGAVNSMDLELKSASAIRDIGIILGYYIPSSANAFLLNENCPMYCYNDISLFGSSHASLYNLNNYTISRYNYKVYTVCASSDSNFHVLSTKSFVSVTGQNYLVVMARLPSHHESKYDTWCKDYERLCRTFKMRPTGCGIKYQWSSKHRSCVEKFQSAMAENDTLGCNSSERVAAIANMAGFSSANANNSFVFHQCSGFGSCPRKLTKDCAEGLSCLNDQHDVVYTLCTDSASAFVVEYVQDTRENNSPLLLIGSTLPDSPHPKNENWCNDYQKLCESFAARPTGCDTFGFEYNLCSKKYNALNLRPNVQKCESDGADDIKRLVDINPILDDGEYFKFGRCKKFRCESTFTKNACHSSLYCLKTARNFLYTTCSRSSNNFEVLEKKWTKYEEIKNVLVIKAAVPSNGVSLHDTWCHDYEKVCSIYGRKPLGCSSRTDYLQDWSAYTSCRDNFNGNMLKNSALPCPLNDIIAQVAQQVGFLLATSTNSLALSTCTSCAKKLNFVKSITSDTLSLSLSSCPSGAVCSNWSSPSTASGPGPEWNNVYLLCVQPPRVSSFLVQEIREASYLGQRFSVFRLEVPSDGLSKVGDWCADYQKLCASVSMRPIACGSGNERIKARRDCRSRYNAVMPKGFSCSPSTTVKYIVKKAGFSGDNYRTFGMYSCSDCSGDIRRSGLHYVQYITGFLYTACSNSDSAFKVIETRNVVVAQTSFMVIKAQLPVDMLSFHENWCKDYQSLCESYGKRPLTCSWACSRSFYNTLYVSSLSCGDVPNLKTIPQAANFSQANDVNTFVLESCGVGKCARRITAIGCSSGGLDCINSALPNREVYTICVSSTTAYDVIATKPVTYNSQKYLAVRVKMPNDGTSRYTTWCHDYREMCKEYGYRPIACKNWKCIHSHGALWMTDYPCPVGSGVSRIASLAGMDFVTSDTNFGYSACYSTTCKKVAYFENCTASGKDPMNCYDRKLNDGEFTTICMAAKTHFSVLDYRTVSYSGREYLVVRTQKQEKYSKKRSWCDDYRELCQSFRMLPLACSAKQRTNYGYHDCKLKFLAVMMENVDHGCPLNDFVAELAHLAGFTAATAGNSFAFKNCSDTLCRNIIAEEDCGEAFGCLNKGGKDLYTVCAGYDTGFKVLDYDTTVNYGSKDYAVIQVETSTYQRLHEDWCRDYQRLCESLNRYPVACYNSDDLNSADVCSDSYGASRVIPCGSAAHNITVASKFTSATSKDVLFMHKCTECPKILNKICADNLNCARSSARLYAICADKATISALSRLDPLLTIPLTYGFRSFLAVQTKLLRYYDSDWGNQYINLCSLYGYIPIGCGKTASDGNSYIDYCRTQYNISSSEGDDFSCPPSDTIAILSRKAGFYEANNMNSFGFYKCSAYVSSSNKYLSISTCYSQVWCLTRYPPRNILYTMCAKPLPTYALGFQVLDKKKVPFLRPSYLAVKIKINVDGNASLDNWCHDYREMCRQFKMVPTGCGSSARESDAAYSACQTKYNSFMPYSDIFTCEDNKSPVKLVRSAGFRDANQVNTFIFNRCDQCRKFLSGTGCDGALNCLHTNVWEKIAYTLCVERLSGFEVLRSANVIHGNHELTVLEAALPKDARAVHENWCHDYQKLCYSFGKFPVACAIDANTPDIRKYSQRYGAVVLDNIPCSPVSTVVNIATTAGYSQATSGNTFVFAAHSNSACPQYMPARGCTAGLDCVNSKDRLVYTVCTNPTNIEISDVLTTSYLGDTFTVVKARLPATGLSKASTWCEEYANLCRALKQQPVACRSMAGSMEYQKCVQDYDAYPLSDKYNCFSDNSSLHEVAQVAGFTDATYGNTFGIKACSVEKCKQQIHSGPDCDASLNCVNSELPNRQVYALCIKDGEISNFNVQETKQFAKSNVHYLAIRALVPYMGISKHESWCEDYEKMCQAYAMRPIRCSPQQNEHCLGQFNALGTSKEKLDCTDNAKLVQLVKKAGFDKSSSNNTFILGSCESSKLCRKTFNSSQCDASLNGCLKRISGNHEVYTVCATSAATSFAYLEAKTAFYQGSSYLVIKTIPASNGFSTTENWCYDYREMCASFGKQPMVQGALLTTDTKRSCFTTYNGTAPAVSQTSRDKVAFAAGFNPGSCAQYFVHCGKCSNTMDTCPFASCSNCPHMYLLCL